MLAQLAAGLALFLFGLQLLTNGLKAIAGARLPAVLRRMTSNRLKGLLAGAAITALLNSSTITTVLLVGFVSAGLMTLGQTVPMIMGANIGSTFTAQIIAFDVSALTPIMLALGFLGYAFGHREILRELGEVVLGFGLLFLGIQFMGDATHPLRTYQPFIEAMHTLENPLLGIVIGALFTAIVQSSAAVLGIIIALASEGLMPLEAAIPLILGANVGTCGTALLASIGKSAEAARVGKLSEQEHTSEDSQEMIKLIETVNDLEGIRDVVSMNLIATGKQRLAERVDLASLLDESTSRFATFMTGTLQETVATLGDANTATPVPVAAMKAEMDSRTIAARKSVLDRVKLTQVQDVLRFRLANDLIEQLRQIGRLNPRIAENAQRAG